MEHRQQRQTGGVARLQGGRTQQQLTQPAEQGRQGQGEEPALLPARPAAERKEGPQAGIGLQ